jgi:diguanylate cyclase
MERRAYRERSVMRLLAGYAAITLIPVLLLGLVLALTFRHEASHRGLLEGRSEATLIAQTAIEPALDNRLLSHTLSKRESADLERIVDTSVRQKDVLRLRLRDLTGRVVFSDDGTGFGTGVDDEALDAVHGHPVTRLTHLNEDGNDVGTAGPEAVEVYLPLRAGVSGRIIGALEIYLPYGPIRNDVQAGMNHLYVDLGIGLVALWIVLFAITLSVSRGLRRELNTNAFLATHDTLTGLPNRRLFLERAQAAIDSASLLGSTVVIAIVDLDRFKDINDALGHDSGDKLLRDLAARLARQMRRGDTVARLGGDEFGLILHDPADPARALTEIRDELARDAEINSLTLSTESSIGYVVAPFDGFVGEHLVTRAEVAMYTAKARHTSVVRYEPGLDGYNAENLALVAELRQAIGAGELVLHYQPQIDPVTGVVHTIEALVRWNHPKHGLIPPDRFLPLAEQTEVIEDLTDWVLDQALQDVHEIPRDRRALHVAVNVSARTIVREDLPDRVRVALENADVEPRRLTIEITETALLIDRPRASKVLRALAEAGVTISLDDFGQGQTSLGSLSELPVGELKIDRSFVTDMCVNPSHAAIVHSIIDLGDNLSMRVVAEGIEDQAVMGKLREVGCDLVQGFHIARPMPLEQLLDWLADRAPKPAQATRTSVPDETAESFVPEAVRSDQAKSLRS